MNNISFFIPAYNCSATLAEAVESIINTNFEAGDELIVVNDCSTDDTEAIIEALKARYPDLVHLNHVRNKGGAAARNTAVECAKNQLLFCLDADNVLSENSISSLKKYLLDNNADVASFQFQHFFSADKLKPDYTWELPEGEIPIDNYLRGGNTPGQHGNYLFTKSSWLKAGGYAEGTGALDTWTFGLRQAITGAKAVVLKDTFYYHRLDHENSYWMRDAEANLSSVSMKATYGLYPFFNRIDEDFLSYMLNDGRYNWYHRRDKKPLKLVPEGVKDAFYQQLNQKSIKRIYPKASLLKRAFNKLKRILSK